MLLMLFTMFLLFVVLCLLVERLLNRHGMLDDPRVLEWQELEQEGIVTNRSPTKKKI